MPLPEPPWPLELPMPEPPIPEPLLERPWPLIPLPPLPLLPPVRPLASAPVSAGLVLPVGASVEGMPDPSEPAPSVVAAEEGMEVGAEVDCVGLGVVGRMVG